MLREAIEKEEPLIIRYKAFKFCRAARAELQDTEYEVYPYEILFLDGRPAFLALINPSEEKEESSALRLFYIEYIKKIITKEQRAANNPRRISYFQKKSEDDSLIKNKEERITLQCSNSIMPLVYERFGPDIVIDRETDESCRAEVSAIITPELFGWIFSFGDNIKLLTPLHATQRMKQWLKALNSSYGL